MGRADGFFFSRCLSSLVCVLGDAQFSRLCQPDALHNGHVASNLISCHRLNRLLVHARSPSRTRQHAGMAHGGMTRKKYFCPDALGRLNWSETAEQGRTYLNALAADPCE